MPEVSEIVTPSHAQILRACLIDLDLVSFPQDQNGSWWCYVGSFADMPDEAVCIKYAPGRLFGRRARDLNMLTHPGVLVLVRAKRHDVAWTKANEIAQALDTDMTPMLVTLPEQEDPDQTQHHIQNVIRTTPIMYVGEEVGKQREIFSINARIAFQDNEPSIG